MMNARTRIDWDNIGRLGLYTVPMASRLIGESGIKIRSWIDGYPNSGAEPIILRQLPPINGRTVLGFLDLIEARFIRHFDKLGLSPQLIRKVAEKLRVLHTTDHPFATNQRFRTDGKKIFIETAQEMASQDSENIVDPVLIEILTDKYYMHPIIEQSLFATILYADDLAARWYPLPELSRIVLDPRYAFGRPVVENAWVPTDILFSAFDAEKSVELVAEDYDIDEDAVNQAIQFEERLRRGAIVEDSAG